MNEGGDGAVLELPEDALVVVLDVRRHAVDKFHGLLGLADLKKTCDDMELVQELMGVCAERLDDMVRAGQLLVDLYVFGAVPEDDKHARLIEGGVFSPGR